MIENNLRKLRNKTTYSQQDVATILNVDRRTYSNWESNAADIKGSFLPQLAEIFGVEIADLFNTDKNINIKQTFNNSSINTAILILTDKASIDRVFDALKQIKTD